MRDPYNATLRPLEESAADPNPFVMFQTWLDFALAENLPKANAMTLATAAVDGKPSARIVLLRGADENGFVFFTDYTRTQGRGSSDNPFACLSFSGSRCTARFAVEGPCPAASRRPSPMPISPHARVGSQIVLFRFPAKSSHPLLRNF